VRKGFSLGRSRYALIVLTLIVALSLSFGIASAYQCLPLSVPHSSFDKTYALEGLYNVIVVNDTPYFVLQAGKNFTVFDYNGQSVISGMGFLGIYPSSLGLVVGSKYYFYLNGQPIMQSPGLFVGGGAYRDYVWAILSNGSVMVWTPNGGYLVKAYGIPKGILFFNNFSAFVNGTVSYLFTTHVNAPTYQEYFFAVVNTGLPGEVNLTEAKVYHIYVSYTVPVSYGFLDGKPYFLGYNITTNSTILYYNGQLHTFEGLPRLLVNFTVPFYVIQQGGDKYLTLFANGSSFEFSLNGTLRVFYTWNEVYFYGISGNRTYVLEPFGTPEVFNASQPLSLVVGNRSVVLTALTTKGFKAFVNLSWNSGMVLQTISLNNGYWTVYLAYPDYYQRLTVATNGSGYISVPPETEVYPNTRYDPLIFCSFKLPNSTGFIYNVTSTTSTNTGFHEVPYTYYIIVGVAVIITAYAGLVALRRKR